MGTLKSPSPATREFLSTTRPLLIDGAWRSGSAGDAPAINPADGSTIGRFSLASPADIDAAVAAARRAFESPAWRELAPSDRARILWRIAELIERDAQCLAELEALDGGKLYRAALQGDVAIAAEAFRYHAGWCTKLSGEELNIGPRSSGFHCYMRREPMGVAALIVPWNGPIAMSCWKLAPALAAGCTAILKPPEQASLSVLRFGALLAEAGLPAGVVNILAGPGSSVGAALADHAGIDKISFTGSTTTGRSIVRAAAGNLKKVTVELGGKSPAIVCADADLDAAARGVADGIFGNAGQVCVASSRLYAERSVYDALLERIVRIARALRVGPGLDPASEMGPLISSEHRAQVASMVNRAVADGAQLAAGGKPLDGPGFFYPPTVLGGLRADMPIVREEVFGPVLCVLPFDDIDSVIAAANDSIFGLAASVWTCDIRKAHRIESGLRAGLIWVNAHGVPNVAVPFGGYRQSGWGREQGREAIESYMELKSVMVSLA